MDILLVAATNFEIQPTINYLAERDCVIGHNRFEVLTTGIGSMSTTYWLTKAIAKRRPQLMIQAGIGGSFSADYPPGSLVLIKEEVTGDLGVEENNEFKDIFDMGLPQIVEPYTGKNLENKQVEMLQQYNLPLVKSVTVNEITTRPARIQQLQQKYQPVVEAMEGAAFHYVALVEKIPFIQLRAVSNMVGERDKSRWRMKDAIDLLNEQLLKMVNSEFVSS
ncbi:MULTISPECIES: futalosine hydrolase [Niastella]|uniref:Futalosine hydrolase n=1 Tax=Niastella soli TaxID=2821487 RepID=A0ABS3YVP7_9BACT|nr:futalosine hydrolase [Niastella soli]MBO9201475.1 futalosine hydrolase [Niastella soli]